MVNVRIQVVLITININNGDDDDENYRSSLSKNKFIEISIMGKECNINEEKRMKGLKE